jgi:hypothetical protein
VKVWFGQAIALLSIPDAGPDGHEARTEIRALVIGIMPGQGEPPWGIEPQTYALRVRRSSV